MNVIKEHIRTGKLKQFYLLYGSEDYLKNLYRNKLRDAILMDADGMNFTRFEGKDIDLINLSDTLFTLPFFSERRLVVIENSSFFKSQSEMPEILPNVPESTFIVFVEEEVDKRNKLFKLVKELGTVSEMNALDERNLKLFAAQLLEQEGKRISEGTAELLLERCGTDMLNIKNETDKLIAYTAGRDIVTDQDVEAVVTAQITGKIFKMVDAIGLKQQKIALKLYYDLIALREKPMSILFMVTRHLNTMMQVKDLLERGLKRDMISGIVGAAPFVVSKCISQSVNFTQKYLLDALEASADMEEQIKTGRMMEKIGVELLIIAFSSKQEELSLS